MCSLDYDPFVYMKASGKRYGYNVIGLETMTMQQGFWKSKTINTRRLDEYFAFPWTVDRNKIGLWNSFEILDLEIYRRKEYSEYVDHMKSLEDVSVSCVRLTIVPKRTMERSTN